MAIHSTELPAIKAYDWKLHAYVIYEYIVNNKTQAQIAESLTLENSWTISTMVRAYNFNRERSASYQGGKDKGKYRGTDRELVNKYVQKHYPGFVDDERITFDKFLEEHRKKSAIHKQPVTSPQSQAKQFNVPKLQYASTRPVNAGPKPPTAAELFQRAVQLSHSQPRSREVEGLFRQAAELGHIDAPYYLAMYYKEYGSLYRGCECAQSFNWFQKAVDRGCEQARRSYAEFFFELGLNAQKNHERIAVSCYEKAAQAGHSGAANNLGIIHENGWFVVKNDLNAVYWYKIAANGENAYAMCNLAYCYQNGTGVKKSRLQALYWFEQGAQRNHSDAKQQAAILAYQLGEHYLNSDEGQERPKAFVYFQKAADYGNQDAIFYLGFCYANGIGVNPNLRRAAEYYEQATQTGSAAALNNLGVLYARGEGVDRNDQQAACFYEQAAIKGYLIAMKNLAFCYKNGKGLEKNVFQAVYWFEHAAECGDDEAKRQVAEIAYFIGEHYLKSKTLNEKEKAYDYFCKSLKRGNNKALLQIGYCLENGYGVEQNYEQAVQHYEQAEAIGIDNAGEWLADCYFEWAKELYEDDCYDEAIELFEKGAALDNEDCMLHLADCYFHGNGVYLDDDTSAHWYKEAAGARYSRESEEEHYIEVAERCFENYEYERGVEWYKRAADLDSGTAMKMLGNYFSNCEYDYGDSDYEQAVEWYKRAIDTANSDCEWELNWCYLKLGEQELQGGDVEGALRWYQKAEELHESEDFQRGFHECFCHLAREAVDQERYTTAMEFYKKAEELENLESQEAVFLAKIGDYLDSVDFLNSAEYLDLVGVFDKPTEEWVIVKPAEEWYKKAALLGHAAARKIIAQWDYRLAREYESKQDGELALFFYRKAAEAGNDHAQLHTGYAFQFGKGVPVDYDAAFHWYNLAAEQENDVADVAHEYLGDLLREGKVNQHHGKKIRLLMAIDQYEQAVRLGNEKARSSLISCNHQLAKEYEANMDFTQAIEIYRQTAEYGSTDSLNSLGLYYMRGIGVPLDYIEAARYLKKTTDQGDVWAEKHLDRLFCHEEDIAEDFQLYEKWYRQATVVRDPEALRNLGLFYMTEERRDYLTAIYWMEQAVKQGDERSAREVVEGYYLLAEDYHLWDNAAWAFHYYKKAAELGHAKAQNMLGVYFSMGIAVVQDEESAAKWYKKSALQGDAYGQYHLGAAYERGQGVKQNDETAVYWYKHSALQGYMHAKHALGVMYKYGRGIPVDLEQAEILMEEVYLQGYSAFEEADKRLAALEGIYRLKYNEAYGTKLINFYERLAQKDENLLYELGLSYETGYCPSLDIQVEKDPNKAYYFYKQACEKNGDDRAILRLGNCYRYGIGTEQDMEKAVEVLERITELDGLVDDLIYQETLNAIGECYFSGEGIERNLGKTFEYCMRAAEKGHAEAQYNVAFCYENGYGVEQDMKKAMEWYEKSAEKGFELGIERLM